MKMVLRMSVVVNSMSGSGCRNLSCFIVLRVLMSVISVVVMVIVFVVFSCLGVCVLLWVMSSGIVISMSVLIGMFMKNMDC